MEAKLRIVVQGTGALGRAIAGGLQGLCVIVETVDGSDVSGREADVLVIAGELVNGVLELAKAVRQKSPDVAIVVAADGSEAMVRGIAGEVGASSRVLGVGTVAYTKRFRDL